MDKATQKRVYQELAIKMRLEKRVKPTLTRYFKSIARDFAALYKLTGIIINAEDYKTEMEAILRNHYRQVTRAFAGTVTNNLKSYGTTIETKDAIGSDVQNRLRELINTEPEIRAGYITETSQSDIDNYVQNAIMLELLRRYQFTSKEAVLYTANRIKEILSSRMASDEAKTSAANEAIRQSGAKGKSEKKALDEPRVITITLELEQISISELLLAIARKVKSKLDKLATERAELIAVTETQNSAEKTKLIEMQSIIDNDSAEGSSIKKQWVAVLDERTRPAHADADGQIVDVDIAFTVGGEKLMVPGDTSLGASLGNIINCRCTSVPVIE